MTIWFGFDFAFFFPLVSFVVFWSGLVCPFFISFFSSSKSFFKYTTIHIFSFFHSSHEPKKKKKRKRKMKSKRVFGCSSQEYEEEEDLAYDTPERKKKQKGVGRSSDKVVRNGTFFLFLRVWFKNWIFTTICRWYNNDFYEWEERRWKTFSGGWWW